MTFDKFLEKYKVGHSYSAPDGSYKGECVSLLKCYIKDVLGVNPQSIGNAKEYWLKRNGKYIQSLFKPIANTPDFVPQRGDVAVRTSGTYGHVMIVISATKHEFKTIEQNAGGCRVVQQLTHTDWKNINFLRPLNQKNIKTVDYYKNYTGSSVHVDTVFKAIGVPAKYIGSWSKRKPVAKANGISVYIGSEKQNQKLIALAKKGTLKKV